ncbi:Glucose-repressible alcohol dehydrogenase transcriptional effector [Podila humilis]|nr:Glucose-repressible alcohol dehydrogenase transcriptional effector [Podila humilis]
MAIVAPIDIQPASRTSVSGSNAIVSVEAHPQSLADSGYESSWPSLLEAAAWLPPPGQRRKGSLSSSDIGAGSGTDMSEVPNDDRHQQPLGQLLETSGTTSTTLLDKKLVLLQHNRGQHSYTRYNNNNSNNNIIINNKHSSGDEQSDNATSSSVGHPRTRLGKRQQRRARAQAQQAKRTAQAHDMMPLVDIGSPQMEEDDDDHGYIEMEPHIPLSVMPRQWLFEENYPLSLHEDIMVSVPRREWVYNANGPMSMDAKSFVVMSWNVLSPRLCHPVRLDAGCHPVYLDWNYRKESIMNQIAFMDADFVCLQELELNDYQEYFAPRLARLGYRSIHAYKMNVYELRDGCAIFYRESRFKLLDEHVLRFNQVELEDNNIKRPSMARDTAIRFNLFHNLALVAMFENRRTRRQFQLATTHLLADPAFPDAKMLQTAILTSKLEELKAAAVTSHRHLNATHNQQHQHHIPTILTGDFNSLPDSPVVSFLQTGKVETRQFGGNDFGRFTRSSCKYFHHHLGLSDSYRTSSLPFTNATRNFQGTIDYLLYDPISLGLVGFLDNFESDRTQEEPETRRRESKTKAAPFLDYSKLFRGGGGGASQSPSSSPEKPLRMRSGSGTTLKPFHMHSQRPQIPRALPSQHFPSDHIPLAAIFREHDFSVQAQQYLSNP